MAELVPSEEAEQVVLVQWLDMIGLKYSAIPNSTYTTSWKVKNRNTRMGVRAGVPDLLIALPGTGTLWIELKRVKGGVVSQYQKEWLAILNDCPGTQAFVCKGAEAAIKVISQFITPVKGVSPTGSVF